VRARPAFDREQGWAAANTAWGRSYQPGCGLRIARGGSAAANSPTIEL